jgi:hypothetical protein
MAHCPRARCCCSLTSVKRAMRRLSSPPPHFGCSGNAGTIVAQPLCQRVRQQLRLRIRNDLQASGPDLMAHCPRAGRMSRRGPDNIARRTRDPAAEASAKVDTSEPATGMTAPFTHDGNSRNAVSASRLASPGVARAGSELPFVGQYNLPPALSARAKPLGRPPPLLVGHQHWRTRKVAPRSSWLSNSSLMKRSRRQPGWRCGTPRVEACS